MPPLSDRVLLAVAPRLGWGVINLIHASQRIDYLGLDHVHRWLREDRRIIISFWHDQLLLMVKGYQHARRTCPGGDVSGKGARILISSSKDGELIARTMRLFGQGTVRGSSSRGGSRALKEMIRLMREPVDLVFTPDGPRGPRHEVKPGVVQLAKISKRPVIPMAYAASKGHRFASWDRFLLPYPFARGVFAFGQPLVCGGDETPQEFAERLQSAMQETEMRACRHLEDCSVPAV